MVRIKKEAAWSRRHWLSVMAPGALMLGTRTDSLLMGCSKPGSPVPERIHQAFRAIDAIYPAPGFHWVGDGFRVIGYFSAIPDALRKLSPFILLDYHAPYHYSPTSRRRGVGVHPHRGFETVTISWQGSVAHRDSSGGGGVIGPGDVQWMTAAGGILHNEYHDASFAQRGGQFQLAQLWVNLPKRYKYDSPKYQGIISGEMGEAPLDEGAGLIRVIAGEYQGVKGPASTYTRINLYDVRLNPKGRVEFDFPAAETAAILVMQGGGTLNQRAPFKTNDFIFFKREGSRIAIQAETASHLLVLNGEPIDEPVVQRGPFVMNTQEEILQAFADLRQGKFGFLEDG